MFENSKFNFSTTDNITAMLSLYDMSGSMSSYVKTMIEANKSFKEDFMRFEDKGSVAISKSYFKGDDDIYIGDFLPIEDFDISYDAYLGTPLYNSIKKAGEYLINYYKEIVKRKRVTPKIVFLVFTDGEDNEKGSSRGNYAMKEAKNVVEELNNLNATTVFVPFGEAKKNNDAEILGFNCIKDCDDIISLMGRELSRSLKQQSKSSYSLGSKFFSQAGIETDVVKEEVYCDDFFD